MGKGGKEEVWRSTLELFRRRQQKRNDMEIKYLQQGTVISLVWKRVSSDGLIKVSHHQASLKLLLTTLKYFSVNFTIQKLLSQCGLIASICCHY